MYEIGLRRLFSDAESTKNNDKIVEKIRGYFNNESWDRIQSRYAWWVMGVIHFMEQENCFSLEVMTEKLQEKIQNAKTLEEITDIRLIFDGTTWLTIQARFCWWIIGVERFQADQRAA
jgi:hypothetical protein